MVSAALFLSVSGFQTPTPTSADRTGETELKTMLRSIKGPANVWVEVESRERTGMDFYNSTYYSVIFKSEKQFRIEQSGYWGDGAAFITDGTTVMIDRLDLAQPVVIRDAKKTFVETFPEFKPGDNNGFVMATLMQGERALAQLVSEKSAVTLDDPDGPLKGVKITHSPFGSLWLLYRESDQSKRIVEARYDNWDSKIAQHEKWPDWVDMPQVGTMDVERYEWRKSKVNWKLALNVTPPKGIAVLDQRAKKPKHR